MTRHEHAPFRTLAEAYRDDILCPAELSDCEQFEAEQAADASNIPAWARKRWIAMYRSIAASLRAGASGSPALKAENDRRAEERQASYSEWGQSR